MRDYIIGMLVALGVLCLAFRRNVQHWRQLWAMLCWRFPQLKTAVETTLGVTSLVLAVIALSNAQLPQGLAFVLFAVKELPVRVTAPQWPTVRRLSGYGFSALSLYTVVVAASAVIACLESLPPRYDLWGVLQELTLLDKLGDILGGVFQGYLLGDLDLFNSNADEPVFLPWSFASAGSCG